MGKQAGHIRREGRLDGRAELAGSLKKVSIGSFLQALASVSGLVAAFLTLWGFLYEVGYMQELRIPASLFLLSFSAQYFLLAGYYVLTLNVIETFQNIMSLWGRYELLGLLGFIALYGAFIAEISRRRQAKLNRGPVITGEQLSKRLFKSRYGSLFFGIITFGSLYLLLPALLSLIIVVIVLPMPAYFYGQKQARSLVAPGECIKPPSVLPEPHCTVLTTKNDERIVGILLVQTERWTAIRSSGKTIVVPSEFKRIERAPDNRSKP